MRVNAPSLDVPTLEARIAPGLEAVEERLHASVSGGRDLIEDLTRHLALAGGKRIRPVLTLVCAQLGELGLASENEHTPAATLSDSTELAQASANIYSNAEPGSRAHKVLTAATAIELTHLATLYHDDVMDSAPTRRGVPSAQHQWGNNRAILAGDILFARASVLIAELGPETVARHAHTFERLCLGQLNETFGPAEGDDPVDFHIQVLADKTGSLVAAAAHFGAWHGGAGDDVAELVAQYGELVGVAFQIADDVIDIAAQGTSGKTPGTDLREGVDTLPVLLLKRRAAQGHIDEAGHRILQMLEGDLSSDEALHEVVVALCAHDVIEETRALAQSWADRAVALLNRLPEGEPRTALEHFARLMVDRMA